MQHDYLGRLIRDYHRERTGSLFHVGDHGFVQYRLEKQVLYIDEFFMEKPHRKGLRALKMIREVIKMAKACGCHTLVGCNETTLSSYSDIRKLHTWFGMHLANCNGTQEVWVKQI